MRKKLLTILGIAVLCIASYAANYMQVNTTDGKKIVYAMDDVEKVKFDDVDHSYVDLGLPSGTLWATCNLGANKPEQAGDYFAWGETEPKDVYDWNTYKYATVTIDGELDSLSRYTLGNKYSGEIDSLSVLLPEDDAATVNWGSEWCMPTYDQMDELMKNCEYKFTEVNGVTGAKFTAKNGNSIFFPAAGRYNGSKRVLLGENGFFWVSSLSVKNDNSGNDLYFNKKEQPGWYYNSRYFGMPIRAVRVKK